MIHPDNGAALITGAGKRLGRAMALALAEDGFDVVIHYHGSVADADDVVAAAQAFGVKAVAVQADLLDREAVAGLVDHAVEVVGKPLSVLINNASIFEHDNWQSATPESWDRHIGSNLYAPLFLTQAFAAQAPGAELDETGEPAASAAVINLVDQRVRKPTPEFLTYSVAKSGLWWLTQTMAQALAPAIRVNAIGPGPTLKGARQSELHFSQQRSATVLNRGANAIDIIRAMRFLLSGQALTGQLICVDGGQHLAWQTPDVLGVE